MKKSILTILSLLPLTAVTAGNFELTGAGTQAGAVYNNREFVKSAVVHIGGMSFGSKNVQHAIQTTDDGKVHNIWNQDPECRFRMEIATAEKGKHLEITYLTEYDAYTPYPARALKVRMPFELFAGADYVARVGRASKVKTVTGKIPADLANGKALLPANCRQVAFSGSKCGNLVIDFNVLGAGDFLSDYSNGAIM